MIQGGTVDYGPHLSLTVAMSNGESEFIATIVAYMTASHLRMMGDDFKNIG